MRLKKTPEQMISELKVLAQNLSLAIVEKMTEGKKVEPDELKHVAEIKKHLKFAESMQKEINISNGVVAKKGKGSSFSVETIEKIKNLQSSIGDIVRQMPAQ